MIGVDPVPMRQTVEARNMKRRNIANESNAGWIEVSGK